MKNFLIEYYEFFLLAAVLMNSVYLILKRFMDEIPTLLIVVLLCIEFCLFAFGVVGFRLSK